MQSTPEAARRIGILALQGAFDAHVQTLSRLGVEPVLVRNRQQLGSSAKPLDGLVIPGGESSTFLRLLERDGFFTVLESFVRHKPVFGTCAGAILLAARVTNPAQASLTALDITVERNGYGRQHESTILYAPTTLPGGPLEMVFIRAPRITQAGPGVEVLATRDGSPVLVRQASLLAATFHPELSSDLRVHEFFLQMITQHAQQPVVHSAGQSAGVHG